MLKASAITAGTGYVVVVHTVMGYIDMGYIVMVHIVMAQSECDYRRTLSAHKQKWRGDPSLAAGVGPGTGAAFKTEESMYAAVYAAMWLKNGPLTRGPLYPKNRPLKLAVVPKIGP